MSTALSTPVRLSLPAHADYVAVARGVLLVAAGRSHLTIDAADDLALAVDEMCAALLGAGATGQLEVVVDAHPAELTVGVSAPLSGEWPPEDWEDGTPALILEALVDGVEFRSDAGTVAIVVTKAPDAPPS